jgi:hypothetical protein
MRARSQAFHVDVPEKKDTMDVRGEGDHLKGLAAVGALVEP